MKIKFGSIVTDGSGKLGGHVYSKNRGGNYVRTNKVPSNPRTAAQILARSRFGQASSGWKSLTELQRKLWEDFAQNNPYTDSLGDLRHLSSSSAYTRSQTNLLNVGKPTILVPSVVQESVHFTAFGAQLDIGEEDISFIITFTGVDDSDKGGAKLLLHASPGFPPSQKYAANKMRVVSSIDITSTNNAMSLDVSTAYTDRFGIPSEGSRVAWRLELIDSNGVSKFFAGGDLITEAP